MIALPPRRVSHACRQHEISSGDAPKQGVQVGSEPRAVGARERGRDAIRREQRAKERRRTLLPFGRGLHGDEGGRENLPVARLRDDQREQGVATGWIDHVRVEARREQVGGDAAEQLLRQSLGGGRGAPVLRRAPCELIHGLECAATDSDLVVAQTEAKGGEYGLVELGRQRDGGERPVLEPRGQHSKVGVRELRVLQQRWRHARQQVSNRRAQRSRVRRLAWVALIFIT
mmetsp:Transcript_31140/g.81427  ORF Transcript_31140/g.81427 Transcript_31140/m.81427 type:complete len:230 (+) Transcript_31140:206-895(+)